jgi:hypothetical protein
MFWALRQMAAHLTCCHFQRGDEGDLSNAFAAEMGRIPGVRLFMLPGNAYFCVTPMVRASCPAADKWINQLWDPGGKAR